MDLSHSQDEERDPCRDRSCGGVSLGSLLESAAQSEEHAGGRDCARVAYDIARIVSCRDHYASAQVLRDARSDGVH